VPKKIPGTYGRYAEAVYVAASKIKALDKVEAELKSFTEVLKKNKSFEAYVNNPTIPRAEKAAKVGELFEEGKISHVSRNLFLTLAANGRIQDVNKVIAAYDELLAESKGIVSATIISAEPLKKKTFDQIQAAVVAMAGAGKTIDLKVQVNESILGGLQVMVGDKFLDLSVSSRIAALTTALDAP